MVNSFFHIASLYAGLMLVDSQSAWAVAKIPFWTPWKVNWEKKKVESLASRFKQAHPDYRIVPVYKGACPQALAVVISAWRHRQCAGYPVKWAPSRMMASHVIKPVLERSSLAAVNRYRVVIVIF